MASVARRQIIGDSGTPINKSQQIVVGTGL